MHLLSPVTITLLLAVLFGCAPQSAPNAGAMPIAAVTSTPVAISCAAPGPKPRAIMVPAGGNPTDFCPASAIIYPYTPGVIYLLPATDVPLPPSKNTGQPP